MRRPEAQRDPPFLPSSLPPLALHPMAWDPSTWSHHLYWCHTLKPSLGSPSHLTCHQNSPRPGVKGLQLLMAVETWGRKGEGEEAGTQQERGGGHLPCSSTPALRPWSLPQGMDKAQGSRSLDKAFSGDPELLERGSPEQQVTLWGRC